MYRYCERCGRELKPGNTDKICFICADKEDVETDLPETWDVEDLRQLLHLEDVETVRRKYRNGELPDCIQGQKKLLWFKDDILAYLRFGQSFPVASMEEIQATVRALKLGVPIERLTFYGLYPENLTDEYGYPHDNEEDQQQ